MLTKEANGLSYVTHDHLLNDAIGSGWVEPGGVTEGHCVISIEYTSPFRFPAGEQTCEPNGKSTASYATRHDLTAGEAIKTDGTRVYVDIYQGSGKDPG
jgi:hypothetical protein